MGPAASRARRDLDGQSLSDVQKDLNLVALLLGEGREIPGVPFQLPEYRKQMYGRPAVKLP